MPGLTPPQLQITTAHRSLGCLYLELDLPTLRTTSLLPPDPMLRLQIHFSSRWQELGEGRVCLGWRRGLLRLQLKGGWIPQSDRLLTPTLELISSEIHSDHRLTLERRSSIFCHPLALPEFPESLVWEFEAGQDQILSGLLPWMDLGRITRTASQLQIQAWFEAKEEDLWILDTEGLWPVTISTNKLVVLRRLLARKLYPTQGQPYLSHLELHYG